MFLLNVTFRNYLHLKYEKEVPARLKTTVTPRHDYSRATTAARIGITPSYIIPMYSIPYLKKSS